MYRQTTSGLATVAAPATATDETASQSHRRNGQYSAAGPRSYAGSLAAVACLVAVAAVSSATKSAADVLLGSSAAQGNGMVTAFADLKEDGSPRAIGVRFGDGALEGLPPARNNTSRCFDLDGNGTMAAHECEGDFELRLPLPEEISARDDIPFSWVISELSACHPIKQPAAWQIAGWYPTSYCIRHDEAGNVHTVSMEDFGLREPNP